MIPDSLITSYLDLLLTGSEPGAMLHTLVVAAASKDARNALGFVDKPDVAMYAIASDTSAKGTDDLVAKTIMAAAIDTRTKGLVIHFAGLALEVNMAPTLQSDEVLENLARRMHADGVLKDHPSVVEATIVYAVSGDGRRWMGVHYLTGPKAGTINGPDLKVGGLDPVERSTLHFQLVRRLVRPLSGSGS